jgi:hypothetical protein
MFILIYHKKDICTLQKTRNMWYISYKSTLNGHRNNLLKPNTQTKNPQAE